MTKRKVSGHKRRTKTKIAVVMPHDREIAEKRKPSVSFNLRNGKKECSAYGIESVSDARHVARLTAILEHELAEAKAARKKEA